MNPMYYQKLVENALRGVVRQALADVSANGLVGEQHFYITFATTAEGVQISDSLRGKHPNEMTIVIQHQFSDLVVDDDTFIVTLSFSGKPEWLRIPFAAITGFADPSAKFALQFIAEAMAEEDSATSPPSKPRVELDGNVVRPAVPGWQGPPATNNDGEEKPPTG